MSERTSSDRSFFSIRYVYPGFAFLLGFFIFNPNLLSIVLESVDDGLFSGIITLIGITPLGFLFGQLWHIGLYIYRLFFQKLRDSISYLDKEIELTGKENQCRFQRNLKLLRIRDFLYHYQFVYAESSKKTERISRYLSRRWDLLNTIGSGYSSYLLALIFGCFMRDWEWFGSKVWENPLKNYSCFYYLFTISFFIVSFLGIYMINKDRQEFITAIFRELGIPNEKIKKAFPNLRLHSPEDKE